MILNCTLGYRTKITKTRIIPAFTVAFILSNPIVEIIRVCVCHGWINKVRIHRILFDIKRQGNLKCAVMSGSLEDILLGGTRQHQGGVYNSTFLRYLEQKDKDKDSERQSKLAAAVWVEV